MRGNSISGIQFPVTHKLMHSTTIHPSAQQIKALLCAEHHYRHWDHATSASPSPSSTFSSQLLWLCVCHRCLGRMSWSPRLQNVMPIWYRSWLWHMYSPEQTLEHRVKETQWIGGGKMKLRTINTCNMHAGTNALCGCVLGRSHDIRIHKIVKNFCS